MEHNTYVSYFRDLAERHHIIRHGHDDRHAFFRINGESEMVQALATDAAFPALVLITYRGRMLGDAGSIQDAMTGSFEIRDNVSDALDYAEIDSARDRCKRIGMDIIRRIQQDWEEEANCGPIPNFDISSVQYDWTGPVNQQEYGCVFLFTFSDEAFDTIDNDLTGIFL